MFKRKIDCRKDEWSCRDFSTWRSLFQQSRVAGVNCKLGGNLTSATRLHRIYQVAGVVCGRLSGSAGAMEAIANYCPARFRATQPVTQGQQLSGGLARDSTAAIGAAGRWRLLNETFCFALNSQSQLLCQVTDVARDAFRERGKIGLNFNISFHRISKNTELASVDLPVIIAFGPTTFHGESADAGGNFLFNLFQVWRRESFSLREVFIAQLLNFLRREVLIDYRAAKAGCILLATDETVLADAGAGVK